MNDKCKIHIKRNILGQNEDLGVFTFHKGDCYQPYWNTICEEEVYKTISLARSMAAFQVSEINTGEISITPLFPALGKEVLSLQKGQAWEVELGKFGQYEIRLVD